LKRLKDIQQLSPENKNHVFALLDAFFKTSEIAKYYVMLNTTWVNKNLIPAIGSTIALVHVFIVILFFENYFIVFQKKSLLDVSISFDELQLAPFIYFFFSIALLKVIWFIVCVLRTFVFYKYIPLNVDNTTTSAHTSFALFVLIVLLGFYLSNASTDYLPINEATHFYWSKLYTAFCFLIMGFSTLIFIFYPPDKVVDITASKN
uniref:hypothetical protein n=1 Tax=uncultured Maribacter sp. TaxID=431308 RepID=UPI00261D1EF2